MLIPRLSFMMFLQFFVWGAWYVTVGNYMTEIGMNEITHWAYTVSPVAAIISPFFLGMVADRYFSTQKVLGILHLIGGAALLLAPAFSGSPLLFILALLVNMLCYMPTLGLSNSLAFHHITDQERQFPRVRVFGTIGWIIAGILVSAVLGADKTAIPFYVAGAAGIALGVYSFSLPHTPAPSRGKKATIGAIIGMDAFKQLRGRSFFVFVLSAMLISIPLAAYYNFAPIFVASSGLEDPAFKMSFGQMSEFLFMLAMPFFFVRLGVKKMLLAGMFAWVLRYVLFALGAEEGTVWLIMGGIILHGVCYDFFFVTGQVYVDKKSTPEIRGQAQGFLVLITYGIGMLIGAQISGMVYNLFLRDTATLTPLQWQDFWYIPAGFAAVVLVFFALFFQDEIKKSERKGAI